ncbi:unnamed protein product, partial [Linum tenue]
KPTISLLFGKERPADHGHATRQALERRVPSTVRQKPSNRWVFKHFLLRTPTRQQSPFLGLVQKLLGKNRGIAHNKVEPFEAISFLFPQVRLKRFQAGFLDFQEVQRAECVDWREGWEERPKNFLF